MHYYKLTPDAVEAAHFQPVKSDPSRTRGTTIRDAIAQGLYPSVTTVQKELAAPGLTNWLAREPLRFLYSGDHDISPADYDEPEGFASAVIKASTEARASQAADRGAEIHDEIEQHLFKGGDKPQYIMDLEETLQRHFGGYVRDVVREDALVHKTAGFAGKPDLCAEFEQGTVLLDWKTKDWEPGKLPKAYWEQAMQLAAYEQMVQQNTDILGAYCVNVFIDRTRLDHHLVTHDAEYLARAWHGFQGALMVWRAKTGYDPRGAE